MPRFVVPSEMAPGIARAGVGFFKPGSIYSWPDARTVKGEKISKLLIPIDKDGYDLLVSMWPDDATSIHQPIGVPKPAEVVDDRMTLKQAAEALEPVTTHAKTAKTRASDR